MRALPSKDFLRLLFDLAGRQATGVVVIERAGVETRLEVRSGRAAAIEGGAIAETLGRLLVDEGALGRASYAAVLAQITDAESRFEKKKFGEVAIACGFLADDQLEPALQGQLKMKVARCIEQDRVRVRFDEGSILEPGPRWAIPIESCVIGALWRFDDPRLADVLRPIRGRRLTVREPLPVISERLGLWDDEVPFLDTLSKRPVEELLEDDRFDAAPILGALVLAGLVAPEGDDGGARAKVLRPKPTRRRWTHLPSARASMKSFSEEEPPSRVRAEAILRKMSNERDDVRGTFANAPRSLAEVRLIAEAAFQLGLGHLAANTLDRAYAEFARAADLVPSAAEYVLYARYTDFAARQARSTGFDAAQRAARTAALEVAVDSALAQMPNLAFGHYVRGQIAALESRETEALASFQRAARLDFDLVDAQRQIRLLELKKRRSGAADDSGATKSVAAESEPPPAEPIPTMEELLAAAPEPPPPGREMALTVPDAVTDLDSPEPPPPPPAPPPPPPPPPAPLTPLATSTVDSDPAVALPSPSRPPPPKRGWLPWAIAAVVVLGVGAGAATLLLDPGKNGGKTASTASATATVSAAATATATATATVSATASVSAAPTVAATATASATATVSVSATASAPPMASASVVPSVTATAAPTATAAATATGGDTGTLVAPAAAAKGHRVLVDGKSVGDAPGPFTVRCGAHTVQIGSHGREQKLTIPCGGELAVQP